MPAPPVAAGCVSAKNAVPLVEATLTRLDGASDFKCEVHLLAVLNHPGIAAIHGNRLEAG